MYASPNPHSLKKDNRGSPMQGIIERDLFTAIKPYLQDKEVLAIHGARQVGI